MEIGITIKLKPKEHNGTQVDLLVKDKCNTVNTKISLWNPFLRYIQFKQLAAQ